MTSDCASESPTPDTLGELTHACAICIGRPHGCRRAPDGTHWCGSRNDYLPGFRVVGSAGALTGYRQRRPDEPISAETHARIDAALAERAKKCAIDREHKVQCAAMTEMGLAALPVKRLAELLADAIATTSAVADMGRDISELAAAVVARRVS